MPRVVSDGTGFLIGWQRGDAFARVNSDGEVVDRPSIRVVPPPNMRRFDLVRHRDAGVVGWYYFLDPGIVHVRVGTLTSTLFDVALPDADINSNAFKLISNGTALAAMFQRKGGGSSILFFDSGRSVSLPMSGVAATDGINFLVLQGTSALLLSGSGDLLGSVAFSFTASDVVFDGTDFVIAGASGNSIEFVRVSRSGAATSLPSVVDSASGSIVGVAVAATTSDVFLSWKETFPGTFPSSAWTVSLQARGISRAGVVRTVSAPMRETVGRFAAWADVPAVASNGRAYLLVWTEGTSLESLPTRSLFSLLLSPMESLSTADIDRRKRPVPSAIATQAAPTSARNGDRLLFAWSETFSDDNSGNFRQHIVADNVVVAPNGSQQQNPSAAWDGNRTWIAWNRSAGGIDATYVLPDGSRRGLALPVSSGGVAPRIACGDEMCLIVWAENRSRDTNPHELFAARIVHGELLDPDGFLIGSGKSYLGGGDYDVAADGAHFEVVW
ncbi:MAG TPA: hypothetical protein VGA10_04950, partial [Thermoanaerobaculia bacterium]